MLIMPDTLTDDNVLPTQPYVTHVLSTMLDNQIFHILPDSSLQPHNPSVLPREYFVPDGTDASTILGGTNLPSSSEIPAEPSKPAKK